MDKLQFFVPQNGPVAYWIRNDVMAKTMDDVALERALLIRGGHAVDMYQQGAVQEILVREKRLHFYSSWLWFYRCWFVGVLFSLCTDPAQWSVFSLLWMGFSAVALHQFSRLRAHYMHP